jgi:hypothetical protein
MVVLVVVDNQLLVLEIEKLEQQLQHLLKEMMVVRPQVAELVVSVLVREFLTKPVVQDSIHQLMEHLQQEVLVVDLLQVAHQDSKVLNQIIVETVAEEEDIQDQDLMLLEQQAVPVSSSSLTQPHKYLKN